MREGGAEEMENGGETIISSDSFKQTVFQELVLKWLLRFKYYI